MNTSRPAYPRPRRGRSLLVWVPIGLITAALGLALLVGATSPQAQPAEVSAQNIIATARALSEADGLPVSRFAPLPGSGAYPAYLLDRLQEVVEPLGGTAVLQQFPPDFDYQGTEPTRSPYANVMARIPGTLGTESPGYFIVGAHLDATGSNTLDWDPWSDPAPGADDNGSGVSTILEAIRVMGERGLRPEADMVVAFFDGEEQNSLGGGRGSLLGSTWMAETLEDQRLYGIVNLDMVAYNPRRDSLVAVVNVGSRWLAESIFQVYDAGAVPNLDFARLFIGLANSDHAPFWEQGYDGLMLSEAGAIPPHNPHYHRVTDTVENIYINTAGPGREPGSMAKKAGELLLGLVETWANTGASRLEVTDQDVLFTYGRVAEAAKVVAGDSVRVVVGVTNRGGTRREPWKVSVNLENADGFVRSLGSMTGAALLPAGAHQKLNFVWIPTEDEAGAVTARVVVEAAGDTGGKHEAVRTVAVEGSASSLIRAYAYPNPTRLPADAVLHYELSRQGAVRLKLLDLRGEILDATDLRYDPVVPGPNVDVGEAEVRLGSAFHGIDRLAPGLYLIRVELFTEDASASAAVEVVKLAILR